MANTVREIGRVCTVTLGHEKPVWQSSLDDPKAIRHAWFLPSDLGMIIGGDDGYTVVVLGPNWIGWMYARDVKIVTQPEDQ